MSLSIKQQRFIEEYAIDANAAQAAIRAGYSSKGANVTGSKLLANPSIKAAIATQAQLQAQRCQITADDVIRDLQRVVRIALADEAVDVEGQINGHSVSGRERKTNLAAAVQALEKIGKHLGMYDQKVNVDGDIRISWEDDDDD